MARNFPDTHNGDDNDNGNDIMPMIMASLGKWGHIEADATWSGMVARVLT